MACNHSPFTFNGIDLNSSGPCHPNSTAFSLFQNKSLFKLHWKTHYCPESVTVETFFTNIAKTVSLLCRSWAGFETISAKLGSISHESFLRQYPMYTPSDDDFNVLCHGDMWINNFLYKYDEDQHPIGVKIVNELFGNILGRMWII